MLAFAHPRELPVKVASRAKFHVSFLVRNVTGGNQDYQWTLLLTCKGRSHRQGGGRMSLPSGYAATLTPTVIMACPAGKAKIVISLTRPAEAINFWTQCISRKRGAA